ncbi:L-lysine N6-monooxygenase MbtG OS=Streptomyces antimycoticus OX=68175 GN=SANT12839_093490 PE=3 SV=1 [Streptomyces antimycoticus]
MDYHGNTNYSVVDIDLIDDLYRQMYQEKVLGVERLRFLNVSRLADVKETATQVRATVTSLVTGEETLLDADVVVFATGYSPADPLGLLGEIAESCSVMTRAASVSSVTTASRRIPGCAAVSICRAVRSIPTASPPPGRPTPRPGSARSWTRSSTCNLFASDRARPVADGVGSTAR